VQNAVPPQIVGVASSMATFARQMGATIGIAIFGTVFATTLSTDLDAKLKVANEGVPPEMIEEIKKGQSAPNEEGGKDQGFDREAIEKKIHESFAARRAQLPPGSDAALQGMKKAEEQASVTVGKVDRALKESFTNAVKRVYWFAVLFAIFGFLATLPLPALPLRQGGGTGGPPSE